MEVKQKMINELKDKYFFMSNFYTAPVIYEGIIYKNNEAAFQAAKTMSVDKRLKFAKLDPTSSKKLGRIIELREDWEDVKYDIMYQICMNKFTQNPKLLIKLLNTSNEEIIYGNDEDKVWGKVDGKGENQLGKILMRIREKFKMGYKFEVEKVIDDLIQWIRDWFNNNGKECNAVIGISGGKDSSVAAALCVQALGADRVIGVMMPNGEQSDINYSELLIQELGIKSYKMNIKDTVESIIRSMKYKNISVKEQTLVNLLARIRMSTLYAVSQSVNGRVVNTCNLSEDWVGYATRYGDAAGDFSPLSQLTTDEVIMIGEYLGLPVELTRKVPLDGLCGKTDEDNLGFTYAVLNRYIRTGECEDVEIKQKIDDMHQKNLFKLELMPCFKPDVRM